MADSLPVAIFQRVAMDLVRPMDAERMAEYCDHGHGDVHRNLPGMEAGVLSVGNIFGESGRNFCGGVAQAVSQFWSGQERLNRNFRAFVADIQIFHDLRNGFHRRNFVRL